MESPPKALNPKQRRFVDEYLVDLSQKKAALRAGYGPSGAGVTACRLLKNPAVAAAVKEAMEHRFARVEIKQDDILRELLRIASADIAEAYDANGQLRPIQEMPEGIRRAIIAMETEEIVEGVGEERRTVGVLRRVKFADKKGALDSLMRHLGLFKDKVDVNVGYTLEKLVPQRKDPTAAAAVIETKAEEQRLLPPTSE